MPTFAAYMLLLVLLIAIATPALVGFRKGVTLAFPFYVVVAAFLAVYHGGVGFGERQATARTQADTATLCRDAVEQSERGGLLLDRSNPNRVSVDGTMWKQLPERAQEALTYCFGAMRSGQPTQTPVEIVQIERR